MTRLSCVERGLPSIWLFLTADFATRLSNRSLGVDKLPSPLKRFNLHRHRK